MHIVKVGGRADKEIVKAALNRMVLQSNYSPILDITHEYIKDLNNGAVLFKVNNSDKSVGIMSYTGDILVEQNILEDTVKTSARFKGVIAYRTNFGNLVVCEIHNTKNGITIEELYNTSFGELDYVFPKAFSIYTPDKGVKVYSRSGRSKNDTGYLRVVEHKTKGVLIGVRFLTVGSDGKVIRSVDVLKPNGSKLHENINNKEWERKYRSIYGVSMNTLYSRSTETIDQLEEKGITKIYINGCMSHFY